jgi:hypothetical protein
LRLTKKAAPAKVAAFLFSALPAAVLQGECKVAVLSGGFGKMQRCSKVFSGAFKEGAVGFRGRAESEGKAGKRARKTVVLKPGGAF